VLEKLGEIPVMAMGVNAEYLRLPDGNVLLNASTMAHCDRVVLKISNIEPGAGPISYRRLHLDLARTIVAGHRALPVHPIEHRTISTREAALLQGFPLDYVFCGRRHTQPLQVANAVPPQLGQAIALSLMASLRGDQHPTLDVDLCGTRQLGIAAARPRGLLRQAAAL
jgi:DNA (cytosine-5)-methyltransferase 1